MDSRTEHAGPPKPREVQIGQEFHPFLPDQSFGRPEKEFLYGIGSKIDLVLPSAPKLPFRFQVHPSEEWRKKWEAISPFKPSNAYQVTSEDLIPEFRSKKLEMLSEGTTEYDHDIDPFILHVVGDNKAIALPEWFSEFDAENDQGLLKPGLSDMLKRLRLRLSFPSVRGSFEGAADDLFIGKEGHTSLVVTSFWKYYPLETGQLSGHEKIGGVESQHSDGTFGILLPEDTTKLAAITAKFVLADGVGRDLSGGASGDNFVPTNRPYR